MEIINIPTPALPEWVKLYNTYDPEHYAPGKRVSAEEWNTLFLASVRQGNYNADTLELLIKVHLPETYATLEAYAELFKDVQDFKERIGKVEDVAYSLNTTIQEANTYAKQAHTTANQAHTIATQIAVTKADKNDTYSKTEVDTLLQNTQASIEMKWWED